MGISYHNPGKFTRSNLQKFFLSSKYRDLHKNEAPGTKLLVKAMREKSRIPVKTAAGIGLFLISEPGQVIHAGVQRQGNAPALFKRVVAFPVFNF